MLKRVKLIYQLVLNMTQTSPEETQYSFPNIWFCPQNIWFYRNTDTETTNLANLSKIVEFLSSWDEREVTMHSITEIISTSDKIEPYSVAPWQIKREKDTETFKIKNVQILEDNFTFDGSQQIHTINKIKAVDFDPVKNQFLIYLSDIINTEEFHTPPKKYLIESTVRYIFILTLQHFVKMPK